MLKVFILILMAQAPDGTIAAADRGTFVSQAACTEAFDKVKEQARRAAVPTGKLVGICMETPWVAKGQGV